jgi:hypothetical protein
VAVFSGVGKNSMVMIIARFFQTSLREDDDDEEQGISFGTSRVGIVNKVVREKFSLLLLSL